MAVAAAGCGELPSTVAPSSSALAPGSNASAATSPLQLVVRDSVLASGASSIVAISDSAYSTAQRLRFLASPVEWSSSDTLVLTVNATGGFQAVGEGTAFIVARWRDRSGSRHIDVVADSQPPVPEEPGPTPPTPPQQPVPPSLDVPAGSPAALPRNFVTIPAAEGTGVVRRVRRGDRLQPVIEAASRGDVILLEQGAVFSEAITLRRKPGSGWITIRTEGAPTTAGRRVQLADTLRFARIQSPGGGSAPLRTEPAASGYWLVNLHVAPAPSQNTLNSLVLLGSTGPEQSTLNAVPRDIVIDRSIVRGRPDMTLRRCISLNSGATAIINSLLLECHEKGADSQGIGGWNGPGPFLIENNRIEGAGQNILFGGADPSIAGLHASDIIIRGNHIRKDPEWHSSRRWSIKNHLQFKMAQRVLISHNILEDVWTESQTGSSIAASTTNQGGGATWAETRDLSIVNNVIRNVGRGITIAADGGGAGRGLLPSRFFIARNVIYRLGAGSRYGGEGEPIRLLGGIPFVTILENTMNGSRHSIHNASDGNPPRRDSLVVARNVVAYGTYGIFGAGFGLNSIKARYSTYRFADNCFYAVENMQSVPMALYPATNRLTAASARAVMPGLQNGDPSIATGSVCASITPPQGTRMGAEAGLVSLLEARVLTGLGLP